MTERGAGVKQDLAAATDLYRQAAERHVRSGQARYGLALLEAAASSATPRAASHGCGGRRWPATPRRPPWSATFYSRGGELPPNYTESATWYGRAAAAGHAASARALGLLYLTGAGVQRDPGGGGALVPPLRRARRPARPCRSRQPGAGRQRQRGGPDRRRASASSRRPRPATWWPRFNFGVCLAEGVGIERNDRQAALWLRRAADWGGERAVLVWPGCLAEGRGVEVDLKEGRFWIAKAAEAGLPDADDGLCRDAAERPRRPARTIRRRWRCSSAAAGQGHVNAIFSVAAMHGGGHEVPGEPAAGAAVLPGAPAERGHAMAQLMLGRYLARGLAGETSPAEAKLWLQRARSQGISQADAELNRLGARPPAAAAAVARAVNQH